jgi:mannose-6-phosphate isomerase-like protein (cupin superfamily)
VAWSINRDMLILTILLAALAAIQIANAQDHRVDPTWLHRNVATAREGKSGMTTPACHYKPLFGEGDADRPSLKGIARYGEAVVDPHGSCTAVQMPQEDEIDVVLQGKGAATYGAEKVVLNPDDYLYIPAGTRHALSNSSDLPMHVIIMGFRTTGSESAPVPEHPLKANIDAVPTQMVSGHPASALYRLLLGDVTSKRDRIAAGRVVTSLFLMEIAPGGTNFPHHHEREEEIYLVLSGHGEMVAGGGTNGIEGKHPAQAGDAYFFRLNSTVGYYSAPDVSTRILAVRSWYPGMAKR